MAASEVGLGIVDESVNGQHLLRIESSGVNNDSPMLDALGFGLGLCREC